MAASSKSPFSCKEGFDSRSCVSTIVLSSYSSGGVEITGTLLQSILCIFKQLPGENNVVLYPVHQLSLGKSLFFFFFSFVESKISSEHSISDDSTYERTPSHRKSLSQWNRKQSLSSCPTKSSVRAQVVRVLCGRYVSVCVGLKGGGEVLLVIWVVYAGLGVEGLGAMNRAVGGEGERGGGRELVQVFGLAGLVLKAVQVLCLRVVGRDGGKESARETRLLVVRIHHI